MASNQLNDPSINDLRYSQQDSHLLAGVPLESGGFEGVTAPNGPTVR